MYTHKEIARLFQEIYEYKNSLRNIVNEKLEKSQFLKEQVCFCLSSLTFFSPSKHLRMVAYQKHKEKSSE